MLLALGAIIYTVLTAKREKLLNKSSLLAIPEDVPWQHMLLRFAAFAIVCGALMAIYMPEKRFIVPLQNPVMWVAITLFNSFFRSTRKGSSTAIFSFSGMKNYSIQQAFLSH